MKNKKILVSINTSWNIINFRIGLLLALQKEGFKIAILAPKDKYSKFFSNYDFEYHNIKINNKGTNPYEDFKLTMNYYKKIKKINPHLILNYTIKPNVYATIAAAKLKIPVINNIAGLGALFVKETITTKIAKYLYKYSQKKANYVFFQNQDDYEYFTNINLVKKSISGVLPGSGIDTEKFKPISKKENDKIVFLLISRLLWHKGIQEYVDAATMIMKKYKNIEFQLLGFIDVVDKMAVPKNKLNKWIEKGIINYLGTSDDVRKEISKCDCIVLPSFYREGTPRTLLESASMGKPIITTNNIGCKDVVDPGINGYLCKKRDSNDLAKKIEKMINLTEQERVTMGIKGREKMLNEFDEKIVIERYLKVINKTI